VTVKLPDGSTYSGPAWGGITEKLNLKADKTSLGTAAGKNTGTTTSDVMQPGMFGIGRPDGVFRFNVTSIDAILSGMAGYGLSVLRNDNQIPEPWYVHNYSPALFMRAGDTYTLWCAPFENLGPIRVFGGADGRGWMTARRILDDVTTTTDSNGFIKKASPVIKLYGDGRFEVNAESEGCTVVRQGRGVYLIDGCTGLNADASWGGTDGGFEIPVDRNKQPRIWLDYKVNADGSVLVRTYHRVHPSAPEFAQNRIGNTDINGVFTETVADGEPVDIPADSFVSVRVEMPENSIWNKKQEAIRIAMEQSMMKEERTDGDNV
ncbi:phage tail protein, partial [Salmonella enterica]|nr:phage tail protein [Salmonella enterica]ELG7062120.1 phage tail protein [Salmonella enterica]ELH8505594.1 phage tail protein [Salmonella enterica]ELL0105233.1 phage tail protein [Salmonella enterica]ELL0796163.1 phage tail protein [Salmonella enterica]